MNFLGIGPLELLLIIILALIFLGPEDLPVVARRLAQWWREVQRVATEASTWVQEELEPELKELERVKEQMGSIQDSVREVDKALKDPVKALSGEAPAQVSTDKDQEVSSSEAPVSRLSSRPLAPPKETIENVSEEAT